MIAPVHPTRILILGGGFGGVYTARRLEQLSRDHRDVEIALVSRDNYMLMTPLLFEASSGVLEPRHAVRAIRAMLESVRFIEADVQRIDVQRQVVVARAWPGQLLELPYDQLVLALGGVTNRQIIPGSEHAMSFKTLADAIFLRNHVIELFERADVETDPDAKRAMLTFVVVGGGLVGVELLGELMGFVHDVCRAYPRVRAEELHFELIEHHPHILAEMDRDLADYAGQTLRRRGATLRTSTRVERMDADHVYFAGGQSIRTETILLAAGVLANPLLKQTSLQTDRKGRVIVDATMRSRSHPNVWALGDCAAIPDPTGTPYPPLAQHALREARVLAGNILAALHHRPLRPFVYETLGMLASLGGYKGVGRIWKIKLKGFPAWWVWRTYYLMQMPGWDRRLRIMLDWTVALFFRHDIVKLDLFGAEHPLRHEEEKLAKTTMRRQRFVEQPPAAPRPV